MKTLTHLADTTAVEIGDIAQVEEDMALTGCDKLGDAHFKGTVSIVLCHATIDREGSHVVRRVLDNPHPVSQASRHHSTAAAAQS